MKFSVSLVAYVAAMASAEEFTSIFNITATPDQVIATTQVPAPGQPGALGQFNYAINSKTDTICFDITLTGVRGTYQSPARTATHIHQAVRGRAGPPRIAFPNPAPNGDETIRRSTGCLTGPFLTGVLMADNVTDTGAGFTLAQIEANPAGFFTDSHTNLFVPGVVRGQLDQSFKILEKEKNGSMITTATLTKTEAVTITQCPTTVTDCPVAPVVTTTEKVYTTICPISELPHYTKPSGPAETHPAPPAETHPSGPADDACVAGCNTAYDACRSTPDANRATCAAEYASCLGYSPFDQSGSLVTPTACSVGPVETHPAPPAETHPAPPVYPSTVTILPVGTGTAAPSPTKSMPSQFTGGASVPQVGGLVMAAAGLVAALL